MDIGVGLGGTGGHIPILRRGGDALHRGVGFTRADATTCATRFNSAGTLETVAANVARFDYDPVTLVPKGLLIEESRTNSIRNPRLEGAVAPSTKPTNMTVYLGGLTGLTETVSNTTSEDGVPCVDWRVTGTPSAAAI